MFSNFIASIKRWFRLRAQRAYTVALFKARWPQLQLRRSGCRCSYCLEDTQAIYDIKRKLSPAGESFQYLGDVLGGVCLRCQAVGQYSDSSGDQVHVNDWSVDHKKRADEAKQDNDDFSNVLDDID